MLRTRSTAATPTVLSDPGSHLSTTACKTRSNVEFTCRLRCSLLPARIPRSAASSANLRAFIESPPVSPTSTPGRNRIITRSSSATKLLQPKCVFAVSDPPNSVLVSEEPTSNPDAVRERQQQPAKLRPGEKRKLFVFGFDSVYGDSVGQASVYSQCFKSYFCDPITTGKPTTIILFGPSQYIRLFHSM